MNIICYDSDKRVLKKFYQWDINQTIIVEGFPTSPLPEFHFCNYSDSKALVVAPVINDGSLEVCVPNILLQQKEPITAYLYTDTANDGHRTMHTIHIPVVPRPQPNDYEYEENITYYSYALLSSEIEEIKRRIEEIAEGGGGGSSGGDGDDCEPISFLEIDGILNLT